MIKKTPYPATAQLGPTTPVDVPPGAAKLFGNDAAAIRVFTVLLDDARENEPVNLGSGTFIWAIAASSKTAELQVQFNDQQSALVPFKQGQAIGGIEFTRSYLTNTAQPGEFITFFVIKETTRRIDTINPSIDTSEVTLQKPTVLDTAADVSCAASAATQVLPTLTTRTRAVIQNLGGDTLRIGDLNVAADRGIPLADGEKIEIISVEAIYAYNPSAATVVEVAVMWEAD